MSEPLSVALRVGANLAARVPRGSFPRGAAVAYLRALIRAYYQREPWNMTGGILHLVVDDHNATDDVIAYCARLAEERADRDAATIACALLGLTYRQRLRLLRGVWPRA